MPGRSVQSPGIWYCQTKRSAGRLVVALKARAATTAALPAQLAEAHPGCILIDVSALVLQEAAKAQRIAELEQAKAAARGKFSSLQVGWHSGSRPMCREGCGCTKCMGPHFSQLVPSSAAMGQAGASCWLSVPASMIVACLHAHCLLGTIPGWPKAARHATCKFECSCRMRRPS